MKKLVVFMYLFLVLGAYCSQNELVKSKNNEIKEGFLDVFKNFPKQVYEMFTVRKTQRKAMIKRVIKLGFTTVGWLVSGQVYSLIFPSLERETSSLNIGDAFNHIFSPSTASLEIGIALVTTAFSMMIWFMIVLLQRENTNASSRKDDDVSVEKALTVPDLLRDIFSWKSIGMQFGYDIVGFMSNQLFWILSSYLPKNMFREKKEITSSLSKFGTSVYSHYKKEMVEEVYNNLYEANNKYISTHDLPK